jgi:hypothetical protein
MPRLIKALHKGLIYATWPYRSAAGGRQNGRLWHLGTRKNRSAGASVLWNEKFKRARAPEREVTGRLGSRTGGSRAGWVPGRRAGGFAAGRCLDKHSGSRTDEVQGVRVRASSGTRNSSANGHLARPGSRTGASGCMCMAGGSGAGWFQNERFWRACGFQNKRFWRAVLASGLVPERVVLGRPGSRTGGSEAAGL